MLSAESCVIESGERPGSFNGTRLSAVAFSFGAAGGMADFMDGAARSALASAGTGWTGAGGFADGGVIEGVAAGGAAGALGAAGLACSGPERGFSVGATEGSLFASDFASDEEVVLAGAVFSDGFV